MVFLVTDLAQRTACAIAIGNGWRTMARCSATEGRRGDGIMVGGWVISTSISSLSMG